MNPMKNKLSTVKTHAICWSVYAAYEIIVAGTLNGRYSHFLYYILFYTLNISLFYFHSGITMRKSFSNAPRTLWLLPFLLLFEMAGYIVLTIFISHALELLRLKRSSLHIDDSFIMGTIWRGMLFILFASGYYLLMSYIEITKDKMKKAIELEQLNGKLIKTEADFLRSQINPHLLFNTLNFVKHTATRDPDRSAEAIKRLTGILDFAMERTTEEMIPLMIELEQIENIIHLNQLRYNGRLSIGYKTIIENEKVQIIPVVLLTIVENLFKHGNLSMSHSPGLISIHSNSDFITIETTNLKNDKFFHETNNSGTGLENISLRLNHYFGNNYLFEHYFEGEFFKLKLKMPVAQTKETIQQITLT